MLEDTIKSFGSVPARLLNSHKGSYGKLLILAGSPGMCGAAALCARAAYRSGTGLVRIVTSEENRIPLQLLIPEAVLSLYREQEELEALLEQEFRWADLCVMGPGLSQSEEARALVEEALRQIRIPLIMDADALNIVSEDPQARKYLYRTAPSSPVLLTPHPGELARLTGRELEEILKDPMRVGRVFARRHDLLLIVKGSHSLLFSRGAERYFQNRTASPALSKAGSGDVLCGCIAGIFEILRAEKGSGESSAALLYRAAALGISAHVTAGRLAAERFGQHGVLAGDTADMLGLALEAVNAPPR